MHRSGTSLVARLFHEAGADMGDPATFYRPDQWNPDGYFEQPDIHAINMPLINGPWGRLAYLRPPAPGTIMRRAARRADQIRQTAAAFKGKVLKETRFCLTLPAWVAHGAHVDAVLVCLREPIQVAHSLRKRNRISLRRGLGLWHLHIERLLANTAALPVWFVSYHQLLDPSTFTTEMQPAFRFCALDPDPASLERLRDHVVKPGMNHHPDTDYPYPPAVATLWDEVRRRHEAQYA